ncbi:NnrS family protein [Ramlibacter sp.]|uniref:NnrS family protein n=1 Tax=Ramlibacter sp. TaxID=1917967 RepID=UPI002C75075A|nr:NnrS family protein [Ramlibacter sp.]HWI83099.1 NnrS family protein [Ramlibacter sp.]
MRPSTISVTPAAAAPAAGAHGLPLLRLGFRPFYLVAALFAAAALPLWIALLLGLVHIELAVPPVLWHAHEMLFGFAMAVVVGFLMTAGRAWTGLPTPRGPALGALVALWIAARCAALAAPYVVYALLDLALLPLVAGIFARVLWKAGNRRNLPLAGILAALSIANLGFHLSALGVIGLAPVRPLYAALALITMIECVIAGRVIPAFTANATPGLKLAAQPRLGPAAMAATGAGLALWVLGAAGPLTAATLLAAAALQLARLWGWQPWVTRGRPILWILHLSYAWLPTGLVLLALAAIGWISASAGVHALAVGATGGLIIGMLTRTARGHTGRPLQVTRPEVLAYALVMTAAVLRVLLPLLMPQWLLAALVAAALAWSAAFVIYLFIYTPWLVQTRLDGKDG